MIKRSELVAKINEQLWEGLYLYVDMEEEFDEAIDEINVELSANYPTFSEIMTEDDSTYSRVVDEVDTEYIPEKYIKNFIVPFVIAAIFRREAEFGNEYYTAKEKADKWINNMFRDFYTLVPEEFQMIESGVFQINQNAVSTDTEDAILPRINPLDD